MSSWIDCGSNHAYKFFSWSTDPNNRYGSPTPTIAQAGISVLHNGLKGQHCESAVHFALPTLTSAIQDRTVPLISLSPLSIGGKLICLACGDIGTITNGVWVPG